MIRKEAERRHQQVFHTFAAHRSQAIENIGTEPRLSQRSTTALKHQIPMRKSCRFGN